MNYELNDCSCTLNNIILRARSVNVFNFTPVLLSSILCYLKSIKVCKSSGFDTIPAKLLRDAASEISVSLTGLINLSLFLGTISDEWKVAKVIPIYKSGKHDNPENYRPISILPVLSKMLEREVHSQLYRHVDTNNLLSPFQCGFRKNYSCETGVTDFTDKIRKNADCGLLTGAIFIDIRRHLTR